MSSTISILSVDNPHFINVTMRSFAILPEPSAITRGIVEALETAA